MEKGSYQGLDPRARTYLTNISSFKLK
jgi:hypothetical protein